MDERAEPDEALVRRLIAAQFPEYVELRVRKVEPGGNDNRTFRIGDDLAARLPSAAGYVAAVEKEQRWLGALAPHLPVPIPSPIAAGLPGEGYPWPWSINRWLEGEPLSRDGVDADRFARDLGAFLVALRAIDPAGAPVAAEHSFFRGAPLTHYEAGARAAARTLPGPVRRASVAILEAALASTWRSPGVWFHGDIAFGNLLVAHGRLGGVIDFGTSGVGDPACDVVIAWTFFEADERRIFRDAVGLDDATWARGRGWALWKALITIAEPGNPSAEDSRRVLANVLADPVVGVASR